MLGQIIHCENVGESPLRLIPVDPTHLDFFREGFADHEICKFLLNCCHTYSVKQEEEWYDRICNDQGSVIWSIDLNGEIIGNAAIGHIDWRLGTGTTGMSLFDRKSWGKGIATRVMYARALCAFQDIGLRCLYTEAMEENEGSWKAAQKVGYKEYGRRPFNGFADGHFLTSVMSYITPELLKKPEF